MPIQIPPTMVHYTREFMSLVPSSIAVASLCYLYSRWYTKDTSTTSTSTSTTTTTTTKPIGSKERDTLSPTSPPLLGIRVLELGSVVAVPTISRIMSDLGAQVLKVEGPGGDYWRSFFLPFEQPRTFSSLFEVTNAGKESIVLDLKSPKDRDVLLSLLSETDVFLTNVRLPSLIKLGLDYTTLHELFPSLVYAHLSAWGSTGPSCTEPGYDLGSFWNVTGMSKSIVGEGEYMKNPLGLGDSSTASLLLTGVMGCLVGGRGGLVETSLLRSGLWVMSPLLLDSVSSTSVVDPLYTDYLTSDGISIVLLGWPSTTRLELERLVLPLLDGTSMTKESLDSYFSGRDYESIERELTEKGITQWKRVVSLEEMLDNSITPASEREGEWRDINAFYKLPGVEDIPSSVRIPFDVYCCDSSQQIPRKRAPELGSVTPSFEWEERPLPCSNNAPSSIDSTIASLPLSSTTIVQLCDYSLTIPSCSYILSSMGATVLTIPTPSLSYWKSTHPSLYHQLFGYTTILDMDMGIDTDNSNSIRQLLVSLSNTNPNTRLVFLTNYSTLSLSQLGVDHSSLLKLLPSLVYGISLPYSMESKSKSNSGDPSLSTFWAFSSLASTIAGKPPTSLPNLPPQFGDILSSFHLSSAVTVALLHLSRTGTGQLVTTSLARTGLWGMSLFQTILSRDRSKTKLLVLDPKECRRVYPVPTAHCFQSSDGVWVQLLGVDMGKHIYRTIRSLGVGGGIGWGVLTSLVGESLWVQGGVLDRLVPVLREVNERLEEAIGGMTMSELEHRFKEWDVWYCRVEGVESAKETEQVKALGIFFESGEQGQEEVFHQMKCPLDIS